MWYIRAKNEIRQIDPEEEWDVAEAGEQVFKLSNIRCDSSKNISHVAEENGEVIGALASGWCRGESVDGKDVAVFSFDLAVDKAHRKKGVGASLIDAAINYYHSTKEAYAGEDGYSMMRIWVINHLLFDIMERKGFELEAHHAGRTKADESAHFVYYG
jgi:GNAT superfamily N-acetyltransferase